MFENLTSDPAVLGTVKIGFAGAMAALLTNLAILTARHGFGMVGKWIKGARAARYEAEDRVIARTSADIDRALRLAGVGKEAKPTAGSGYTAGPFFSDQFYFSPKRDEAAKQTARKQNPVFKYGDMVRAKADTTNTCGMKVRGGTAWHVGSSTSMDETVFDLQGYGWGRVADFEMISKWS